jgi:hypothetical protein
MKRLSLILGSLAVASVAFATTYVRVEKDGSKTYSDRPLPGGQPIVLESAQTYTPPPAQTTTNSNVPAEQRLLQEMDDFRYSSCSISPENGATFTNPESVAIAVQTSPGLRGSDKVALTVDGAQVSANATSYMLQPAHRGEHSVQVTIRDNYGRVLCTASSSFNVFRPTLNSPARRPRPTPH